MKCKKNITRLLALAMMMAALTGCAENQIPERTAEEMQAIGEYVAFTLMKYDMGHSSRLMDLPPVEESKDAGGARPEEEEPDSTLGMDPVDDTPVINEPEPNEEAPQPETYSMEEVMGLPEGVAVSFEGYGTYDSYPADSDAFAVTAADGKKLLVLDFTLTNTLAQEQSMDLMASDARYRITVNEEYAQWSLPTLLLNDMSSYQGTLAAGEAAEAVLVIELDAGVADAISSISLNLKNESKSHTIQLHGGAGE